MKQGLVALDNFYRSSLSKTSTKKRQKAWTCPDAVAIRYCLTYIFDLVRTQGGSTGARYPALAQLKEMVQTDATIRASSRSSLDPAKNQTSSIIERTLKNPGVLSGEGELGVSYMDLPLWSALNLRSSAWHRPLRALQKSRSTYSRHQAPPSPLSR